MRCGCIDIGSNTTRLLVADCADGTLREVAAQRAFTSLGAGCGPDRALAPPKIADVAAAVSQQLAYARACGCEQVDVVATAAVRCAPNAALLQQAVGDASGARVRVLAETEEAAYAFRGATAGLAGDDLVGVVDVGGGSTELVLGRPGGAPVWSHSVAVGSATLPATSDPPLVAELDALRDRVSALFSSVDVPESPTRALAAGGSATSMYLLVGEKLSPEALAGALAQLSAAPAAEVASNTGLDPRRIALLPRGLVLLEAAGAAFGAPLEIARGGMREGILLEAAGRLAR